jgi:hypothetical protein
MWSWIGIGIRQKNADPTGSGSDLRDTGRHVRYLYGDPAGEVFIAIEQAGCPIEGMSRVVNRWTLLKTNGYGTGINLILKDHRNRLKIL